MQICDTEELFQDELLTRDFDGTIQIHSRCPGFIHPVAKVLGCDYVFPAKKFVIVLLLCVPMKLLQII